MKRRKTKVLWVGNVPIGGEHPISVQSMTNTDTRDVMATVAQIEKLVHGGCEIVRLAVPDMEAAEALGKIKQMVRVPLIADIHFDYQLAIKALDVGIDGLRINPGNIGSKDKVKAILDRGRERKVPIRIGVNGGSLEKRLLEQYGGITSEGMVESALSHIRILEELNYPWLKVSLKSSNVPLMLQAYKELGQKVDYPFHIGVTEAGTLKRGLIKSGVGIGSLLTAGLGDTLRVSLTDDPLEEVQAGFEILKVLELREKGATLISCPTCGRTEINLIELAKKVEELIATLDTPITVAVMGCPVNGPGEAREADIGIAGGKGKAVIFKKGIILKTVSEWEMLEVFKEEIMQVVAEYKEEN